MPAACRSAPDACHRASSSARPARLLVQMRRWTPWPGSRRCSWTRPVPRPARGAPPLALNTLETLTLTQGPPSPCRSAPGCASAGWLPAPTAWPYASATRPAHSQGRAWIPGFPGLDVAAWPTVTQARGQAGKPWTLALPLARGRAGRSHRRRRRWAKAWRHMAAQRPLCGALGAPHRRAHRASRTGARLMPVK